MIEGAARKVRSLVTGVVREQEPALYYRVESCTHVTNSLPVEEGLQ